MQAGGHLLCTPALSTRQAEEENAHAEVAFFIISEAICLSVGSYEGRYEGRYLDNHEHPHTHPSPLHMAELRQRPFRALWSTLVVGLSSSSTAGIDWVLGSWCWVLAGFFLVSGFWLLASGERDDAGVGGAREGRGARRIQRWIIVPF